MKRDRRVRVRMMVLGVLAATATLLATAAASDAAVLDAGGSSVTVTRFDDPEGMGSCPSDCSLRQAMAYVGAGGTVELPAGTYTLAGGELLDDVGVTLSGAGARSTTIEQDSPEPDHVLEVDGVPTEVDGVTITGGQAGGAQVDDGGGILVDSAGSLDLVDSTVTGNEAADGGGIYESDGAQQVTVTGSTISANSADQAGGGIGDDEGGELQMDDITVAGNTAGTTGGGVWVGGATATLTNDTVLDNSAPDGAAVEMAEAAVHAVNTILDAADGPDCGDAGIDSDGHNIAADDTCDLTATGDQPSTDPALGQLFDNGGQTDTALPDASSPAIDAGDDGACPSVDQRGVTRPQGAHCDIGSVEVGSSGSGTGSGGGLSATTGGATDVLRDSATVHGLVDPGGAAATAYFQYGTGTEYSSRTPDQDAGSADGYVAAAQLFGLSAHTTYHYRIVAVDGTTTVDGADHVFTTLGPPLVTTGSATNVTGTSATLAGTINPQTSDTHYHFEYGTTPAYGSSIPAAAENDLGPSDQADHSVSVDLPHRSLQADTTYHFRLVADNQDGTTDGPDESFTTLPAPPTVDDESASASGRSLELRATVEPHGLGGSYYFEWVLGCDYYVDQTCEFTHEPSGSTPTTSFSPSDDGDVVVLKQSIPLTPGQHVYFHVVVSTAAGNTTGPGGNLAVPDAAPPTVTAGRVGDHQRGMLTLTGTIAPDGYPAGYHFHVRLAGTCNDGGQSVDTPEQQLGGGNFGVLPVSAPLTVAPGTTLSVTLVADYSTLSGPATAQSTAAVLRAAGTSDAGDTLGIGNLQPASADVGAFLAASSHFARATPDLPGPLHTGWNTGAPSVWTPPLVVHVVYGKSPQYGATAPDATWSADGSAPTCAFLGRFGLTGLTPSSVYHYRLETGYWVDAAELNPLCQVNCLAEQFVALAGTHDQIFRTPSGTASSSATASPGSGKGSQGVTCATASPCAGSATWGSTGPSQQSAADPTARAAAHRSRTIVLGWATFRVPGHSRRTVTIHLSAAGRRLLRARPRITVIEVLRMRSGNGRTVTTRRLVKVRIAASARRGR